MDLYYNKETIMKKTSAVLFFLVLLLVSTLCFAEYEGTYEIDKYITFAAPAHNPNTSFDVDLDDPPTYRIYEDDTETPVATGSMILFDDANTTGYYKKRLQLSAANGFSVDHDYHIRISGLLTGTASKVIKFKIETKAKLGPFE